MFQSHRVVIIGGGYAGVMAALRLSPARSAQITLINARDSFVQRIRLHQSLAGQKPRQYTLANLLKGKKVKLLIGTVTEMNPAQKCVSVQTGDTMQTVEYDTLIYAAGSVVNQTTVPGAYEHAFTLSVNSVAQMAQKLPEIARRGGKFLVIGGGLTGIESATELAESYPGLNVSLLTRGGIAEGLSAKGRRYLRQTLADMGVKLIEHTGVQEVQAAGVLTTDNQFIAADACLWAGGFVPSSLARESGLTVNALGQIVIDEALRSVSHPDIYAAGDSAFFAPETGLKMRMACATALPMAATAADNVRAIIAGKTPKPMNFGYMVQCISLGRYRGLLQFVNTDDTPQEKVVTGCAGAIAKEMICQYTIATLQLERLIPGSYIVPKGKTAQARLVTQPQI